MKTYKVADVRRDLPWIQHQLHVLAEYGFNEMQVYFDEDGGESVEFGLLEEMQDHLWIERWVR